MSKYRHLIQGVVEQWEDGSGNSHVCVPVGMIQGTARERNQRKINLFEESKYFENAGRPGVEYTMEGLFCESQRTSQREPFKS